MDNINVEKVREVLENGAAEAQELIREPAKVDALLEQMQEKLKEVPGVGDLLANIPLTVSLIKSYITREYTEVSPKVIVTVISAFLYLVKKKDLIRDTTPMIGYIDDLAVLGLAMKFVDPELKAYEQWKSGETAVQPAAALLAENTAEAAPEANVQSEADAPAEEPASPEEAVPADLEKPE